MTDPNRYALLASVLAAPDDDFPRLLFSDWLDENGEGERAEFIRVQVELARMGAETLERTDPYTRPAELEHARCELRRRERELLKACWTPYFRTTLFPGVEPLGIEVGGLEMRWVGGIDCEPRRGFPWRVTLDWHSWCIHGNRLTWWEGATDEAPKKPCPVNRDPRHDIFDEPGKPFQWRSHANCPSCRGTLEVSGGRIPRPVTEASQPIEEVRLTATIPTLHITDITGFISLPVGTGSVLFTRAKCETCGPDEQCAQCYGDGAVRLNAWTCPAWPSVQRFVMPEAAEQPLRGQIIGFDAEESVRTFNRNRSR